MTKSSNLIFLFFVISIFWLLLSISGSDFTSLVYDILVVVICQFIIKLTMIFTRFMIYFLTTPSIVPFYIVLVHFYLQNMGIAGVLWGVFFTRKIYNHDSSVLWRGGVFIFEGKVL